MNSTSPSKSIEKPDSCLKAQVTMEYLLLTLIGLALLTVSIVSLGIIKQSAERSFRMLSFSSYVNNLYTTMNEVCAMGTGNSQSVSISYFPIEITYTDVGVRKIYRFNDDAINASIVKTAICPLSTGKIVKENAIIKNKGGYIEIA